MLGGAAMTETQSDLGEALDQLVDLRDRLDKALASAESHQAARGRAVNAAQAALSAMERARDVLQRCGELDEAALMQAAIRRLQEGAR
jgi:hypothetical protein